MGFLTKIMCSCFWQKYCHPGHPSIFTMLSCWSSQILSNISWHISFPWRPYQSPSHGGVGSILECKFQCLAGVGIEHYRKAPKTVYTLFTSSISLEPSSLNPWKTGKNMSSSKVPTSSLPWLPSQQPSVHQEFSPWEVAGHRRWPRPCPGPRHRHRPSGYCSWLRNVKEQRCQKGSLYEIQRYIFPMECRRGSFAKKVAKSALHWTHWMLVFLTPIKCKAHFPCNLNTSTGWNYWLGELWAGHQDLPTSAFSTCLPPTPKHNEWTVDKSEWDQWINLAKHPAIWRT